MSIRVFAVLLCAAAIASPAAAQDDPLKAAYDSSPCQMCHGAAGEGDVGPALVPLAYDQSELTGIARTGIGHMPAIPRSEISDADLQLVFTFLKKRTEESKTTGVDADPKAGNDPGIAAIQSRIDRARRTNDVEALGSVAEDARKLAAEADVASAYARFEAIVQRPAADTEREPQRIEAAALLKKIVSALKESQPLTPGDGRLVFLEGVSAALSSDAAGGPEKAERLLRQATELLAKPASSEWPVWNAADAWAWLGRVLAARGDLVGARRAYQKALEIEPNFIWVTRVLLPALR